MRVFDRRRTAGLLIFAAATATVGGSAHAVLNNVSVNVSDVVGDVSIDLLSDILNDLHLFSCDQTNVMANEGEANRQDYPQENRQDNTQKNRCSISVLNVKDLLNDLSIDGLLGDGINVLTEGN